MSQYIARRLVQTDPSGLWDHPDLVLHAAPDPGRPGQRDAWRAGD